MDTYPQRLQIVSVPLSLQPRLKKYQTSSAALRDFLTGGGARRSGEAGQGDALDDPVVETMAARERDNGETAWPAGNSGPPSLDASETLLRSNDSLGMLAASCGWDSGGLSAVRVRVFLPRAIADSGALGRGRIWGSIHTQAYISVDPSQAIGVTSGVLLFMTN